LGMFEEDGRFTAIGGMPAAILASEPLLNLITAALLASPTIDTVHLSTGGIDLLASYHTSMTADQRAALWSSIRANVQKVVNHILSVRPNIRVLIVDYDYLNLFESVLGLGPLDRSNEALLLWAYLGFPTPSQINGAFIELGREKLELAQETPRCEYIQNFGLMQYCFGYPSIFLLPGTVPFPGTAASDYWPMPGGYPAYPSPPEAMNRSGLKLDAIHLNRTGYTYLVLNCVQQYYLDWMLHPFVPDTTPPEVNSITLKNENPTNAATVTFLVTFNERVVGVDATDFAVQATGSLTGARVIDAAGSGTTYTVTAETGAGEGNLGVTVLDDDTIWDEWHNPFGGPGAGNGSFTDGEQYYIDNVGPRFTIAADAGCPTGANPYKVYVTANEPVFGLSVSDVNTKNGGIAYFEGIAAEYSFDLISFEPGEVRVWVPAGAAQDAVGNWNDESDHFVCAYTGPGISNPLTLYVSDGSDGRLTVAEGNLLIDTDALTMSGAYEAQGRDEFGVCVFDFLSVDIGGGVTVTVQGQRPLAIASKTNVLWGASLDVSAAVPGRAGGGVGCVGGVGGVGGMGGGKAAPPCNSKSRFRREASSATSSCLVLPASFISPSSFRVGRNEG